jgi:hypothetical protein
MGITKSQTIVVVNVLEIVFAASFVTETPLSALRQSDSASIRWNINHVSIRNRMIPATMVGASVGSEPFFLILEIAFATSRCTEVFWARVNPVFLA